VRWLPLIGTALGLLGLFALSELAGRHGLPTETTRRVVHVTGAGTAALFPIYLGLPEVVVLAVAFTLFLGWTRVRGSLASVHAVARPTLGAVVFPVGLLLAAVAVWAQPPAFSYAALVLAFADPLASVVGQRFASPSWRVGGGRKSALGSVGFFAVAFILGMAFALAAGNGAILAVAAVAGVLALVEATLGYGLDNLFIPVVAGLLGEQWLGL
jgi:dolichol kinase